MQNYFPLVFGMYVVHTADILIANVTESKDHLWNPSAESRKFCLTIQIQQIHQYSLNGLKTLVYHVWKKVCSMDICRRFNSLRRSRKIRGGIWSRWSLSNKHTVSRSSEVLDVVLNLILYLGLNIFRGSLNQLMLVQNYLAVSKDSVFWYISLESLQWIVSLPDLVQVSQFRFLFRPQHFCAELALFDLF